MQYELFYLVGERQEAKLGEIKESVNALLAQEGATLVGEELLEKRKLAYEIKHQSKGTYVTRRFELPENEAGAENEKEHGIETLTKKMNLMSDVLRFLVVKTDALPELGAKEKRQAQEQAAKPASRGEARPAKDQRRPGQSAPRPYQRPAAAAPVAPTPASKVEVAKEDAAEAKVAEKENTEAKKEKKAAKDIDKQLEELLNI